MRKNQKEKKTKIPFQLKFMLAVLAVYALMAFLNGEFAVQVLEDFLETLKKILPIMGIVFAVMFLLNIFINPEAIQRHLGADSGVKGWLGTILGSILISGPPYILMPLLSELRKNGMKTSLAAVFLSNRSVQPVFLPVMAFYFGWQYTILLSLLIIIFSIINGLIIGNFIKDNPSSGW